MATDAERLALTLSPEASLLSASAFAALESLDGCASTDRIEGQERATGFLVGVSVCFDEIHERVISVTVNGAIFPGERYLEGVLASDFVVEQFLVFAPEATPVATLAP